MPAEPTDAIVLRTIEFSETSLIVTLLTRQFGRIGALAKGARRPKAPFEGALDLLSVCRVMLLHKPSDTLDLLTEAKLVRRFRAGQRDLRRLYAGYYVIELLRELTDEGDPHPELFDLAFQVQAELHTTPNLSATIASFEAQLLHLTGHFPLLTECSHCGRAVDLALDRHYFSVPSGGLLCSVCRSGQTGIVVIGETVRRIWSAFADQQDWVIPDGWSPAVAGELRGLTFRWLSHLLGHRLAMFDEPLWQHESPASP